MADTQNEHRFANMFSSVKDLAKVWNVDIPQELQQYMQDIEEFLTMEQFEKINFSEAAMLVQHSTNVYSKRVETLYDLVFGVFESIVSSRKKVGDKSRSKNKVSFLTEDIDNDVVCIVDHLIKKGKNIDQEDTGSEEPLLHRRIPLWLLPREESDRRKHEFKINGCFIHSSGAFLLSESDARMYEAVDEEEAPYEGEYDIAHFLNNPPVVPAPPVHINQMNDFVPVEDLSQDDRQIVGISDSQKKENEEQDKRREEEKEKEAALRGGLCGTPVALQPGGTGRPGTPAFGLTPGLGAITPGHAGDEITARREPDNPFSLLDAHQIVGTKQPLVAANTSKPPSHILLMKYSELIKKKVPLDEDLVDAAYYEADAMSMQHVAGTTLDECEDLFFSTVPHRPKNLLVPRMGYSTCMLPWEEYLRKAQHAAELERREKLKQQRLLDKAGGGGGDAEAVLEEIVEQFPEEPEPESEVDEEPLEQWGANDLEANQVVLSDEKVLNARELRRQQVAQLEAQIEEAQKSYEQVVRHHLDTLTHANDQSLRMTGIYKNVRKWQDALVPVLAEQAKHREFDFQLYGLELLDHIDEKQCVDDTATHWPFKELCEGLPRYEVCRLFLTSLFLTNQGNLDIEYANDEERYKFILHLLHSSKNFDALADEEGRAFAKVVKDRERKKKAVDAEPIADAPQEAPAPIMDAAATNGHEKRPKQKAGKRKDTNGDSQSQKKKRKCA